MILGIDASNIRGGGGLTHLVGLLTAADPVKHKFEKVVVWASQPTLESIPDRPWLLKRTDTLLDRNFLFRALWQWRHLGELAKKENCSLLFIPGGSFVTNFRPIVTMSQNLIPFEWNEIKRFGFSLFTVKWLLLRLSQSVSFKRANGILFLTKNARDFVLRVTGPLSGKNVVISHGLDQRFFTPPRKQLKILDYNYENPFRLIYVSSIEPYKHHRNVIEAVSKLRNNGDPLVLDLYGSPGTSFFMNKLYKIMQRYDSAGNFIRYNRLVQHGEIHKKYIESNIAIFASSCETFGQILIEGMASGLPTACSSMSAMPEILGNTGIYFDPLNSDSIASALDVLIKSPKLREENALKSYNHAKQFSWIRCADETFRYYNHVLYENT